VFNPHDLRWTFMSNFLDSGGDLPLAQRQAGHSDISTTARYDRREDVKLQETVERLWLPSPANLRDAEPVPQEASK
jgi:site-specific recombinase XerD